MLSSNLMPTCPLLSCSLHFSDETKQLQHREMHSFSHALMPFLSLLEDGFSLWLCRHLKLLLFFCFKIISHRTFSQWSLSLAWSKTVIIPFLYCLCRLCLNVDSLSESIIMRNYHRHSASKTTTSHEGFLQINIYLWQAQRNLGFRSISFNYPIVWVLTLLFFLNLPVCPIVVQLSCTHADFHLPWVPVLIYDLQTPYHCSSALFQISWSKISSISFYSSKGVLFTLPSPHTLFSHFSLEFYKSNPV